MHTVIIFRPHYHYLCIHTRSPTCAWLFCFSPQLDNLYRLMDEADKRMYWRRFNKNPAPEVSECHIYSRILHTP